MIKAANQGPIVASFARCATRESASSHPFPFLASLLYYEPPPPPHSSSASTSLPVRIRNIKLKINR